MAIDDGRAELRARFTEATGEVFIPRMDRYTTNPYEVDAQNKTLKDPLTGLAIRNKFPQYQADAFRGTTAYEEQLQQNREELDEDVNQRPVNFANLAIPTSTSNPSRPRTLAAGYYLYVGERAKPYADRRGKITVMFRDGVFWNYYNVPPGVWREFKGSISKGPMLNRKNRFQGSDGILLSYPNGPADVSDVPDELQRIVYRVARGTQDSKATKYKRDVQVGNRTVRTTYVPTSAQKQVKYSKGKTTTNTRRGQNPYQK